MPFKITKKFATSVERTPRVLEVAEAFGIGLSEKEFTLYDGVQLDVRVGDVVYITGQSGSGKSVLLRELARQMKGQAEWGQVVSIDDVELEDRPLVDQVGASTNEAVGLLSMAGVNDAYLLLRKPSELSDGQRYRLRLAKLIEQSADVWVADEFGAVLDRTTAKVVAFNMQKAARRFGKTLIVATTHTDLEEELGANLVVHKRYQDRIDILENRDEATTPAVDPEDMGYRIGRGGKVKSTGELIAEQMPEDAQMPESRPEDASEIDLDDLAALMEGKEDR